MAYRSNRIRATAGVEVLAPDPIPKRTTNALLDILCLPLVASLPRKTVELAGQSIPLHYGFRRWAWRTERCVEIALGKRAVSNYSPATVLEVGNVLPLATRCEHSVVDKYEAGPGVINEDIVDFKPSRSYELVVSFSTLEHVGWDEMPQDPGKAAKALEVIGNLGKDLLVTIPIGHHPTLATAFVDGPFDLVVLLRKISRSACWVQRPIGEMESILYGQPYACGNGILVGVRGTPLRL